MPSEFDKLYEENEKLVYKFATDYKLLSDEDMIQNLKLAMFRALQRYNPNKGIALSTYVYTTLYHEYKYSFRDKNLKINYVSNIIKDENGKKSSIFDFIAIETIDIDYELDKQAMFKIINEYLNSCDEESRNIFNDYYFENIKQKDLAKKYNLSQGQISRKIKYMIKCLQELLKEYK